MQLADNRRQPNRQWAAE